MYIYRSVCSLLSTESRSFFSKERQRERERMSVCAYVLGCVWIYGQQMRPSSLWLHRALIFSFSAVFSVVYFIRFLEFLVCYFIFSRFCCLLAAAVAVSVRLSFGFGRFCDGMLRLFGFIFLPFFCQRADSQNHITTMFYFLCSPSLVSGTQFPKISAVSECAVVFWSAWHPTLVDEFHWKP